jgi:hypothetical protein
LHFVQVLAEVVEEAVVAEEGRVADRMVDAATR